MNQIIQQEMIKVYESFARERKEIYENMEIEKNMALIQKISNLIQVDERDLYQIIYLQKLWSQIISDFYKNFPKKINIWRIS